VKDKDSNQECSREKDIFNFFPLSQENLADLVPHVRIKSIPNGSHVMMYDHADLVNTLIRKFVED